MILSGMRKNVYYFHNCVCTDFKENYKNIYNRHIKPGISGIQNDSNLCFQFFKQLIYKYIHI